MVTLLKRKSYQWLILTVAGLGIWGLVVSMGAKLEPKTAVRPMNLQKGLVLYYSFDTDASRKVTDLSGRSNDGKVRSGTYISNGKIGRAMVFNGDGDYIDIGDDPSIQTEVFTLSAWIKTSSTEEVWQPIISFENQSYAVSVLPNGRVHYGWQGVKRGGEGKSDVRTGEWVFVAVTRDSNDIASIYVDGELENSFVCDTSSKFLYGGKIGGDTIDKEYFKGSIDEVRMYNRTLSPLEIKQLYNTTLSASESKPSKSLDIVSQDIRIEPDPNEGQIKVSGVVFDEQGKPVPDVLITFLPMGGKEYVTNVKGEFSGIYSLKNAPQRGFLKHRPNVYVFARCSERNLAAAVQIPDGKERKLKITLTDAVTLTGQITDPDGRPVVGARIDILLCDDDWRGYIDPRGRWRKDNLTIDNKGDLKIKTIPHGCFYEIIAWAEGYGEETIEMGTWDSHKKEIDIGKIILPPTNLSVSGVVIDGNSAPVPNAIIRLKGEGQVYHEPIKTDEAGKFTIEKLCEGIITIQASAEDFSLRGEKTVRAGEKDVEIVVEKTISVCRTGPTPPSLTGKKLPEFSGLSVDINKAQIKNRMVLICFWDVNMQSSRHCIKKLAHMYKELKKKDIVVVSICASEIDKKLVPNLVKKFDIPFPVGTIDGKIEDIQFKWGIDSIDLLPWCILADRNHVVIKEGFGLQVLREIENESAGQDEGESDVSKLLVALEDEKYAHIHSFIIPLVNEIGNKESISFLVEQLKSENRQRRCNAALTLELLGDKQGVPAIIKELKDVSHRPTERIKSDGREDQEGQVRQDHYYAALLLGILHDERAVPALIEATQDEIIDYQAAISLGQVGDKRAIPALHDMLERCSNKSFSRLFAGYGLAMLGDEEGLEVVIETLNNHELDWTIRRHAIEALEKLGDKEAVPYLIAALKDEHPNIRVSAAKALGAIKDIMALPALRQALEDKTETKVNAPITVSDAAAKAIAQIEGKKGVSADNLIVPGQRVGDYKLGMSKDDVLKILGKAEAGNSIRVDGLIINIIDDTVKSIDVLSPLYKFANGLGVGRSEQKIKQAFGDDFQLKETEFKDFLIYAKEGLQFEIDKKNRTVMELSVTQKNARELGGSFAEPIKSVNEFDDVSEKDLGKLDLSARKGLIDTLGFDQRTIWPEQAKMPPGDNPNKILTDAMNPGLGVRELHQRGITGKGVNVAIIDQPLYLDHPEYAGKIIEYYDAGCGSSKNSMHGPGMASQLVGNQCGTAPDARVYYAAVPSWKVDAAYYADALDWIITQNKALPVSEKIRVVSVSAQPSGAGATYKNQPLWDQAVQRAKENDILVLDCTWHHGIVSVCWLDSQNRESVESCTPGFRKGTLKVDKGHIHVPTAPRTVAQCYSEKSFGYLYDSGGGGSSRPMSKGGYSDAIPYAAGVLALGWQVRPELPPQQMQELLFKSAFTDKNGAKIINPKNFIQMVKIARIAARQNQQQKISREHSNNNTIVPGERVGDFTLGMSKDDVLKSLGKPKAIFYGDEKYTLENLPRKYIMLFDGISFGIVDDSVEGIDVLGPGYKFANGLGVGSSEQEIKKAFGDDFELEETEFKDFLIYAKEGLQFEIDKKNRTVMELSVYQTTGEHRDGEVQPKGEVKRQIKQPPGPIKFPKIDRKPKADVGKAVEMKSLPKYNPKSSNPFQVDLRCKDLSKLDLRKSTYDLLHATFDDRTVWPAPSQMPADFDRQKIMELGKNPGLGVRSLHKKGITGRGVSVAIIDQPLLVDHQEYADRLRLYEEIHIKSGTDPQMHGPGVASIAVGKTVGVAPEAELYYIAQFNFDWEGVRTLTYLAQGIQRIVEINEQLPKDKKIRVISISKGWGPSDEGYKEITEAVRKAKAKDILVLCTSVEKIYEGCDFGGLGRSPLANPDIFGSYGPGLFLARAFEAGRLSPTDGCFWVPMDSRTTASPGGVDEYVFYREGGFSWAVPYIAGVYALALQVDPDVTPERFWELAVKTGRIIELDHKGEKCSFGPILDPVKLIATLQK